MSGFHVFVQWAFNVDLLFALLGNFMNVIGKFQKLKQNALTEGKPQNT